MDKLSRLQVLTGELDITSSELNSDSGWDQTSVTAAHIYEGTDSEGEDNEVKSGKHVPEEVSSDNLDLADSPQTGLDLGRCEIDVFAEFKDYQLGQLAPEETKFCPLAAVRKYPYAYIGSEDRQTVAEIFFDKNQLLDNNSWDLFYVYKNSSPFSETIILVPTQQFEALLLRINDYLGLTLHLPARANGAFEVAFDHDGTPCPRYLGRSESHLDVETMKKNIPPSAYKLKGERDVGKPTDRSLDAFRRKIELLQEAQKHQKRANAQKKKAERLAGIQTMSHAVKRVQRYLALRETRTLFQSLSKGNQLDPTKFKPDNLAPFVFEGDVVFVCVDIEAWERDQNKITEIGISTLDTRDIANVAPGEGGKNWMDALRARHFRISEYKHLVNKDFVVGCADMFEFGESEFISLKNAASVIASCFRHPFSKGESLPGEYPKRNVILVGHDTQQDVNYMRKLGFEVHNMPNLMEQVDTASMWRYVTRSVNPRNLGSILADIGLTGWYLHNAGNDAVYTLQAMIGIAIKAIAEKQKSREQLEMERAKRVEDAVTDAQKLAVEREEEWNTNDESDGGNPIKPVVNSTGPFGIEKQGQSHILEQANKAANQSVGPDPGDKKAQKAQKMQQRRGWDQDEARTEGGWGSIQYATSEQGDWQLDSAPYNQAPFHMHDENEFPDLKGQFVSNSAGGQRLNTQQQRWGGLQHNFVSAGVNQNNNQEVIGGSATTEAEEAANNNVASNGIGYGGHIHAW